MSKKNSKNKLLKIVHDQNLIDFFYLNYTIDDLIEKIHSLKFKDFSSKHREIPFTAKNREYIGAYDNEDYFWLVKEIKDEEILEHKLFELAYYLDLRLQTLSAPSILIKQEGKFYRGTKLVTGAMQIHSYNYLQPDFLKVLACDLINRWLFFDEDRNPNNYLVIQNSIKTPLIVAIDNNKVDLLSDEIKITGNEKKFGWHRKEKTRFLTLLKPDNFENLSINIFDHRLRRLMEITEEELKRYCKKIFVEDVENSKETTDLVVSNILKRREYIDQYFRKFFKEHDETKEQEQDARYAGLGKSFLDYYKKK
ncbi:MAG: hypothetical protein MJB14_08715 [Spirochaetes bacterium]|nr:hypothetical protein [Spirochaetota bacterium]